MKRTIFFLLILLIPAFLGANENESGDSNTQAPPTELNPMGKRRLEENRQIIIKNIETSLTNSENSKKNVTALSKELKSLKDIQDELLELKKQYQAFLNQAKAETETNEAALKRLKNQPSLGGKNTELEQRELWKKDTETKVKNVTGLMSALNLNLSKIQKKLQELEEKRNHWVDRGKLHQKIADELTEKKLETEKKLRGES